MNEQESAAWAAVLEARKAYEQERTSEALAAFDEALDDYHMTRGQLAWERVRAEADARKVAGK